MVEAGGAARRKPEAARIGDSRDVAVRVRYSETDRMGIAYHGEYLVWFEVGRTDWLRGGPAGGGLTYRELEERGYLLPVHEVSSKYHLPARYDDELVVRTTLAEASRLRLVFDYRVLRADDGRLLATGRSAHVVTDAHGRPRRLPVALLNRIVGGTS